GGWKMVAARRAAGRIVDALGGADRFALLAFDDVVDTFGSDSAGDPSGGGAAGIALHPATDTTRYRAVEWLAGIDARGGTELASALRAALGAVAGSSRPTVVVLVTDGQVSDEDRLAELAAQSGPNVRIHCVGIDQAVNGGLLERLSRAGHGQCELVESEDRLDEVLVGVHRRIRAPELRAVTLAAQGIELLAKSWSPTGVLDAFPGVPLQITGRYSAAAAASRRAEASRTSAVAGRGPLQDATIVVRALAADGSAVEHHLVPLAGEGPLAAIWGRSRIRDLEDAYAVRGDESLASAIVATSLATGVLSRHTAFVAVDDAERVARAAGAPARLIQPVEAPAGWASLHNISGAPAAGAGAALIARGRRAHKREAAGAMGAASPLPARAMRSQIVPAPTAPPPTGSAPTAPPVAAPPVAVPPAAVASAAKLDDTAWVPRQDEDTEAALACQPAHGEDPVAVQHEVAKPMPAGHGDELGEASDVVREIAEIARQGRLDRAAALRAAMRLIEVLLALLEWGEDESELAVALRRLVTVLVEGDGAAAALAADAVSVLLAASSAALTGNRRGGAFWRRRPATPAG
ncbi:MAG TPA: VWA domain-containing protein, partial [Acidimicrobiales bacterium]|nr:VWA domain-containing protein [Acidimicrobiales bacterium]